MVMSISREIIQQTLQIYVGKEIYHLTRYSMREALETDSRLIGPNSVRELAIDSHHEGLDE